MQHNQRYIEHLEEIYAATFSFGRDTQGQKELRETLNAAINSLKSGHNNNVEKRS